MRITNANNFKVEKLLVRENVRGGVVIGGVNSYY